MHRWSVVGSSKLINVSVWRGNEFLTSTTKSPTSIKFIVSERIDFFQVNPFLERSKLDDQLVDFDISTRWKLLQEVNQKKSFQPQIKINKV
jgi:hypothetical protein